MTQYVINIGNLPNDGTGDPLRTAFNDVNLNFNQVWATGLVNSNIQIANNTILTTNTNGNLILNPNGIGNVVANAHVTPDRTRVRNLGTPTLYWDTLYVWYANVGGNLTISGGITVDGPATLNGNVLINGNLQVEGNVTYIDSNVVDIKDKNITLAYGSANAQTANGAGITIAGANAQLYYNYPTNTWNTNIGLAVPNVTFPDGSVLDTANTVYIGQVPNNKGDGNLWFNSDDGRGYVKYNNQWIEFCPPVIPNPATYLGNLTIDGSENSTLYFPPGGNIVFGDGSIQDTAYTGSGNIDFTNVASNIIPSANLTYSLGNSTRWWTNAWFSSNTIYIGGVPIGTDGNVLTVDGANVVTTTNLPLATNSTVGGMALGNGFTLNASNQVSTSSLYNTNLTQPTQHYALRVDTNGVVILPDQSIINGSTLRAVAGSYAGLTTNDGENSWMWVDASGAYIATQYNESGNSHQWTFDNIGNLTLPGNINVASDVSATGNVAGNYVFGNASFMTGVLTGNTLSDPVLYVANDTQTAPGLTGAGYAVGNASGILVTWLYDNSTTSWQSNQNILPTANVSKNLGANTLQWNKLYVANTVANAITLKNTDDFAQIVFSNDGGTTNNGQIKVDGGTNMVVSAASNFYVKRAGSDRIAVTDTTSDFMAATNVRIQSNKAGSAQTWTFDTTGNLTVPGNIIMTTGIVGSGASPAPYLSGFDSVSAVTLSASGNVTGNYIVGNGATLSNVATQVTGSWTVTTGTNTYSFTVGSGTYSMWVTCNIPNGIIAWNATATVTNTNVPVVGTQYAWVYNGGGTPIDFTSIPNQFTSTANAIVRSNVAPSATTNRFDFGINNTSGGNVTVNYGYTKL
jgi:hypothetical protein